MEKSFKDLEEYGVIGNLETCALVGSDGSVDWLCLPYLESPSVFASLLDLDRGGVFSITPTEKFRSIQKYIGDTNVLKTTFHTSLGTAAITDFMPVKTIEDPQFRTTLFRKVEWLEKGESELRLEFSPRFDYGRGAPEMKPVKSGVVAQWQDRKIFFHCPVPLEIQDGSARGIIRGREGQTLWFVLQYNNQKPLKDTQYEDFLARTCGFWNEWAHRCDRKKCTFAGPWHDLVVRSGLILKMLTNTDNGAIAAAATTSLPEQIGGVRNWDYRFSWIRDSAFTVQALYQLGHDEEAAQFRRWLRSIVSCAHDPGNLKILYPLRRESDTAERIIENFGGYKNSGPVRIGNGAAGQQQLDIYGELMNTLYETTRYGDEIPEEYWPIIREIIDHVCTIWKLPDSGLWEARSPPQHYVYSKVMCWVALDRGIKMARFKRFDAPWKKWVPVQKEIRKAVLEKGFSKKLNSFVRSFGSEEVDASGLRIPFLGFLPFRDRRVQGTIDAVLKYLSNSDGFVARYRADDGLPGSEGSFVICSFWMVKALSLSGRHSEAEDFFIKTLNRMSPLGIISEEVDPQTGKLMGNLPQAFSQIGLINAALHINLARGKRHRGPKPIGEEHRVKGRRSR